MENVQIKLPSGELVTAELITYFELVDTGKKYIFYTLNEQIENDLIKMYVVEVANENEQILAGQKMPEQEWNNLKNVMRSILTGNDNPNVKYLKTGDV